MRLLKANGDDGAEPRREGGRAVSPDDVLVVKVVSSGALGAAGGTAPDGLRAAHVDRASVVNELNQHALAGRLSMEEFAERMQRAHEAVTLADLHVLQDDLPELATPPSSSIATWRMLRWHVAAYVLINAIVFAALVLFGGDALLVEQVYWPIWPLLAWGAGVVEHARQVVGT